VLTLESTVKWIKSLQQVYAEHKDYLTQLDSSIGDADHGINMDRGFTMVSKELDNQPPKSIYTTLMTTSRTLIKTIGGASGPLYGTFFLELAKALKGIDEVSLPEVADAFKAGVDGVIKRGKAGPGDKTMLDVLLPAVETMQKNSQKEGVTNSEVMREVVAVAEKGVENTIEMVAKKGRASYLGKRSRGHQDPGATSSYYMLKAALENW